MKFIVYICDSFIKMPLLFKILLEKLRRQVPRNVVALRPIKLLLPLPAPRALPIVGQVLEGHAVVLGGVIHVAADGADVLAGGLLLGEIHFGQDGRHGVV